jgi:hypothetical protein
MGQLARSSTLKRGCECRGLARCRMHYIYVSTSRSYCIALSRTCAAEKIDQYVTKI